MDNNEIAPSTTPQVLTLERINEIHEDVCARFTEKYRWIPFARAVESEVVAAAVWRPIESAPKDGTEILLSAPAETVDGKLVEARVTLGQWSAPSETPRLKYVDGFAPEPVYEEWEPYWASWDGGFTEEHPPTHWMTKPAGPDAATLPPASAAGDSGAGEREAFIAFLTVSFPNNYSREQAEHHWHHDHVSALTWQARAALATKPQAEQEAAALTWQNVFEVALKETWEMVNPLAPAGAPGSYARGEYNGIVAALKTVRDNHARALRAARASNSGGAA